MIRYSTLLLATSLALHGPDNHVATSAATRAVNEPNQAHTFLEIKNDNDTTDDDERMISFSKMMVRLLPKVKPQPELLPTEQSKLVTPEEIFASILNKVYDHPSPRKVDLVTEHNGHPSPSHVDLVTELNDHPPPSNVDLVMKAMETSEIEIGRKIFENNRLFLVDEFVKIWGLEAVAKALLFKAQDSSNQNTKEMANTLLVDLMQSWFERMGRDYKKVFNLVGLQSRSVDDTDTWWRFALHEKFVDRHSAEVKDLFNTLIDNFGSEKEFARYISLAAKEGEDTEWRVKNFQKKYIAYLESGEVTLASFIRRLGFVNDGYKMFEQPEFELLEKFARFRSNEDITKALVRNFGAYNQGTYNLAIAISKGLKEPGCKQKAEKYEKLLFQYLKDRDRVPAKIKINRASDPESSFLERYRDWYDQQPNVDSNVDHA